MNTKRLRILALAAVCAWPAAATKAQQLAHPNQGQAAMGLEQFQAMPVAYQPSAVPAMNASHRNIEYGDGYSGPQSSGHHYEGAAYEGSQYHGSSGPADGHYFDPYQGHGHDVGCGAPIAECFDAIYPAGHCYGYTRAEVFALKRDIKNDQAFTSLRVSGPIVLSINDIDFEWEAGLRGVAGVPLSECLILEASYFGLHEFSDTAAAVDPAGNLFSVYSDFGTSAGFIVNGRQILDFIDGSNLQSISYESELHNAELNLMYRIPVRSCKQEGWLIAGARYVKLEESLTYLTQTQTNDPILRIRESVSTVDTDNDLVGAQLGGMLHHHVTHKLRVSLDAKVGMMVNYAEQRSFVTTNLFELGREEVRDDILALVTDAGVGLAFDVTCWFSITGGYRMMYLDGVALAPRNFNTELPQSGVRQPFVDHNGSILYHGAHVGAEIRW